MMFSVYFYRLGSHLSPSGTECYITSDMFYVEVQLDNSGQLVDVKVAHQGENPTVSLVLLYQYICVYVHRCKTIRSHFMFLNDRVVQS